jgi:hypothetical protein
LAVSWFLPHRGSLLSACLLAGLPALCAQQQAALLKEHRFVQSDAATVREDSTRPAWRFHAVADASASGLAFTVPGESPQPLALSPVTGNYEFAEDFPVEGALDSIFPDGAFSLAWNGRAIPLRLEGGAYPGAPLAEPSAGRWEAGALVVDPSQPETLTLRFGRGYVPGGAYLEIAVAQQSSGAGGYAGRASSGAGGAIDFQLRQVALTIPANTLADGATCRVELVLCRCGSVDQASVPGVALVAGWATSTTFLLKAESAGPGPAASASPYQALVSAGGRPSLLSR